MALELAKLLITTGIKDFDLTPRDLADSLWLSTRLFDTIDATQIVSDVSHADPIPPASLLDAPAAESSPAPADDDPLIDSRIESEPPSFAHSQKHDIDSAVSEGAQVYAHGMADDGKKISGHSVRIPEAPVIPRMLEIERALRPIARRKPSKTLRELDEGATVDFIANTGIWSVVERPAKERWLEGILVVEQSPTMRLWQDTARELRNLLWRIGAFRWLEFVYFNSATQEPCLQSPADTQQHRSLRSVCRPNSSRTIFLCTDCLSDAWLSGKVPEALSFWSRHHPTTVIQVLPEDMWRRTSLRNANFFVGRAVSPASFPTTTYAGIQNAKSQPITVTSLRPESLHQLAEFLVSAPHNRVLCYSNSPDDFRELSDGTELESAVAGDSYDVDQIFSRFISMVSPFTIDLARNLAAAPLLLPVMRLIQHVLVPDSQPAHLAELFNSGILRRLSAPSAKENVNQIEYDFVEGIRDLLIGQGSFSRISRVWKVLDEYIGSRFEKGGDFSAILKDPASATEYSSGMKGAAREPFTRVFSFVLARLGGEFAKAAEQLERVPEVSGITAISQYEQLVATTHPLPTPRGWIWSVAVSPNGKWLASASQDETVKVWDLDTGECLRELRGHLGQVTTVAITPDGKRIISGSADSSIRVWDANSDRTIAILHGHESVVWTVCTFADNTRVLSGGWDGTLRLWDITTQTCITVFGPIEPIVSCAVNETGTEAITGHRDGRLCFWSLDSGDIRIRWHSNIVNAIQITQDGRFAVSGSSDMTIKLWELKTASCVGTLEGHQDVIQSITVSSDGALIASAGSQDRSVRIWSSKSGVCLQVITSEDLWTPIALAFTPDNSRLVVGTVDSTIYIYRIADTRSATPVEPVRRYVNAKVVLLGEGTVGKTSLAHRLVEDKYVVRERTHGMSVFRLDLSPMLDANERGDFVEREALLWDLAGQEDYRLIHQLFLDETALALLLVNPQRDDPFSDTGDWIKALKSARRDGSGETPMLLIFSQADVAGLKLSSAKIQQFSEHHGFTEWLPTSAKTGENCSDEANGGHPSRLKQLIAHHIPWERLPWTSTPRLLVELKNAIMTMHDETDIRLVRFAELYQRIEQTLPDEDFGESELRTTITLLANNGLVRPLEFGDLILLQPELINGYAGAIIRAARAHKDEIGCVLEADIYRPDFNFTGVERLKNRPDEELLLHAIIQTLLDHSLCLTENTPSGRQLVFPSQYRRERDIPHDPDVFVSYTFSGEWQTVWTTLVVRVWYSQEFEHKELWRNAAEFATAHGHLLGLKIDHKQGEGSATIGLYCDKGVPDDLKAIFIEYIHRHLTRFAIDVVRNRRYVCQTCGQPVNDTDAVRRRLEAGKDFIYCQRCDDKVPLVDFIEQRLKSDPISRKLIAMDSVGEHDLDNQALEQILIGHMMAICGEANQIFRPTTYIDYGIDGEIEFKDDNGKASGKKIYLQLHTENTYLRTRKSDGTEIFEVINASDIQSWRNQPIEIYLVVRQKDETTGAQSIRWMNVTQYLKERKRKNSRRIVFRGEKVDLEAVWSVRDQVFNKIRTPELHESDIAQEKAEEERQNLQEINFKSDLQEEGIGAMYNPEIYNQESINAGQRKINYAFCMVDVKVIAALKVTVDILKTIAALPAIAPHLDGVDFRMMEAVINEAYKTSQAVAGIRPPGCDPS